MLGRLFADEDAFGHSTNFNRYSWPAPDQPQANMFQRASCQSDVGPQSDTDSTISSYLQRSASPELFNSSGMISDQLLLSFLTGSAHGDMGDSTANPFIQSSLPDLLHRDTYPLGTFLPKQHPGIISQPQPKQPPSLPHSHDPGSMQVTAATDPSQAAGLVNFALAQPGSSYFVLTVAGNGGGAAAAAANVLRVVQITKRTSASSIAQLSNQAASPATILLPFLASDDSSDVGVMVMRKPLLPHFLLPLQPSAPPLHVEQGSNPIGMGSAICAALMSNNGGPIDVLFAAHVAAAALQALAVARVNLTSSNQSLLAFVLPPGPGQSSKSPSSFYHLRIACLNKALSPGHMLLVADALDHHESSSSGQQAPYSQMPTPDHSNALGVQQHHHQVASAYAMAHCTAAFAGQQQQLQLDAFLAAAALASSNPLSALSPPILPTPNQAHALKQQQVTQQTQQQSLQQHQQQQAQPPTMPPRVARSKLADFVIVNEDTQVKNAAGALAKVLGRIAHQGLGCPLYTEKRSISFTSVVGVGVKAITVSRGYILNEGTGHEVAFQPFLRIPDHLVSAPVLDQFAEEKDLLEQLPHSPSQPVLLKCAENQVSSSTVSDVDSDRCELAFDVFKVPTVEESTCPAHPPVKVTAHSRVNAVASIISRLVDKVGSLELVTAGGRAMHVAMLAVIQARSHLAAIGVDLLLLPRFHTVDTMISHGYESVFLRFHIIKALPIPLPATANNSGRNSRFIMTPV